MTQTRENIQRATEFNTLFLNLNDRGQETALAVLQALEFAQAVIFSQDTENQRDPKKQLV